MSDSLGPHWLQNARLPCPSPTLRTCSNSCSLGWWCNSTISSSVIPFSCPQSLPAGGSFPVSQFFASGGQSIEASVSVSIFPMNIQDWFPLWLTVLIPLQCKGLSRVFSITTVQKHQFFGSQFSLWPISHILTWLLEKTIALTIWTFVGKVMFLFFKMLSSFVTGFFFFFSQGEIIF